MFGWMALMDGGFLQLYTFQWLIDMSANFSKMEKIKHKIIPSIQIISTHKIPF